METIQHNIAMNVNRRRPDGIKTNGVPYKVLIVDDSPVLRMIITRILKSESFEIAGEATNGREAVEQYNILQPDLVTMDIDMPEMNGIDAMKVIREGNPDATILMLTGDHESGTVLEALKNGATNYVVKTAERNVILSKVRQTLKKTEK